MSVRRIKKDIEKFNATPPTNCEIIVRGNNIKNITGIIYGPEKTPFEGGIYELDIKFPDDYPFKPPKCTFVTKIFHPNISLSGSICLDTLKSQWSPALGISQLLLSICSLLDNPNAEDPLNSEASQLYKRDLDMYNQKVMQYRDAYATGKK